MSVGRSVGRFFGWSVKPKRKIAENVWNRMRTHLFHQSCYSSFHSLSYSDGLFTESRTLIWKKGQSRPIPLKHYFVLQWNWNSCFSGLTLDLFSYCNDWVQIFQWNKKFIWFLSIETRKFFFLSKLSSFNISKFFFFMNLVFVVNIFSYHINFCVSEGKNFSYLQSFFYSWILFLL